MNSSYKPIDCNYYDRLEAWATRHEIVTIQYLQGSLPETISGIIMDLFIRDKVEWLKLDNGTEIRLDQLIEVNNIPLPGHC